MSENVSLQTNLSGANTPSKLRPPKARKQHEHHVAEALAEVIAPTIAATVEERPSSSSQKRRLDSPRTARERERETKSVGAASTAGNGGAGSNSRPSLPAELPQPSIVGDRMVKTYKTSAAATSRPAPVTKPFPRGQVVAGKAVGMGKGRSYDPLASISSATGGRPVWDKSVPPG